MTATTEPWIVIKLGGVSVSRADYWDNVIAVVRDYRRAGKRVLVVQSALSGVTNKLETLLNSTSSDAREAVIDAIHATHAALANDMAINVEAELAPVFTTLRQNAAELESDASPALRARILAAGELLGSRLSAAYLKHCGVDSVLIDARHWLHGASDPNQSERSQYLSTTCNSTPDIDKTLRLTKIGDVVLTQGFIASNEAGETVVLGRGGSDTSAAYFASIINAERLEIWTDVAGLFSADPREVHAARLLKQLDYDEAQEICTTGAKVLHPRCIGPIRQASIPLRIRYTPDPSLPGTLISHDTPDERGRVKAVSVRHAVILISMETVGMWNQVGFLSDAFACFKRRNLSVDLVSTSETNVTVSIDPAANLVTNATLEALRADLSAYCEPRIVDGCAAISLVGRRMRANLHRIAPALELFEQRRVYLLSQAANDLNFTFVVDHKDAGRLVRDLHARLVQPVVNDPVLGPTWNELTAPPGTAQTTPWWSAKRDTLLSLAKNDSPLYVYDIDSVRTAAQGLLGLKNVDRVFFSIKANHHPAILRVVHELGLGFECVAPGELNHIDTHFPSLNPTRLLYTPNFAPAADYQAGFNANAQVTLDNLYPLHAWPELFGDRDIFLRVDPGRGKGHHHHVRTAGQYSKFGIPLDELPTAAKLAASVGARVVGLHAHVGSGVFDAQNWQDTGRALAECRDYFPTVQYLDLGGGLGVPETDDQSPFDLAQLDESLKIVKDQCPECELWLEPGRYLVAAAGVLLTHVTQLKGKGDTRYIGVDTGMNSLIRPALYGAWHPIVNLSKLDEPVAGAYDVVGPICETGDILGHSRVLPDTREGDVIMIGNAGAYGRVMSSSYNMREPAAEVIVE